MYDSLSLVEQLEWIYEEKWVVYQNPLLAYVLGGFADCQHSDSTRHRREHPTFLYELENQQELRFISVFYLCFAMIAVFSGSALS